MVRSGRAWCYRTGATRVSENTLLLGSSVNRGNCRPEGERKFCQVNQLFIYFLLAFNSTHICLLENVRSD
jgi:hypothetical protein